MNRQLIKRIRLMKDMSQLEFSQALGVSRGLVAQVEAGYIKPSSELNHKIRALVGDEFIDSVSRLLN